MNKPFAPASDRNKEPILEVLGRLLGAPAKVLEIGSGTGQHAVHFAAALSHLTWQCTDLPGELPGMQLWLEEAGLANVLPPIAMDVRNRPWPFRGFDAVYTANTIHIMDWEGVREAFAGASETLADGGRMLIYGPFRYHGQHTSEGNQSFDEQLRARGTGSGIRDIDDLTVLADETGLHLVDDIAMPANNRILVWGRPS